MSESPPSVAGTVAIVGRPNAGKSTLLNTALRQKLSIVSAKAQTTRGRLLGVYHAPGVQIGFIDTPGHHEAWSPLNRAMVQVAEQALDEADAVLLLIDAQPAARALNEGRSILSKGERVLVERIRAAGKPCVLALNKVDRVQRPLLLPILAAWAEAHPFAALVPISALKGTQVPVLLDELRKVLPAAPPLYPEDTLTDRSERYLVAELVREKLFMHLKEELPYSVAVEIEVFDESEREATPARVRVAARIWVERDSQKAIVIGRGGEMLKRIGTEARKDIAGLLDARVHLDLHVAVREGWSQDPGVIQRLELA